VLTKNGNYLIVNRLCFLSLLSLFLFRSLSLSLSLSFSLSRRLYLPSPLHPLTWYTHLAAIVIHTGRLSLLVADGEQEEKRRCAVSRTGDRKGGASGGWATLPTAERLCTRLKGFSLDFISHPITWYTRGRERERGADEGMETSGEGGRGGGRPRERKRVEGTSQRTTRARGVKIY